MDDGGAQSAAAVAVIHCVTKSFGSGETAVHALAAVDLEIAPGELVVILGPSGSGKTTLLNILGGIETPTTGTVHLAGHDLGDLSSKAMTEIRCNVLGFVYQFFNLIPTLTARENIAVIAELVGGDVTARVDEVLDAVGLEALGDRFPRQLSGGQQQRAAIARSLVNKPQLILCDEPTGALEADTGRVVLGLLQRLCRLEGRAVVIVTHNVAIAAMGDRMVRLGSGKIVEQTRNDCPVDASEIVW